MSSSEKQILNQNPRKSAEQSSYAEVSRWRFYSNLGAWLPKSIHAVSDKGFVLKWIMLIVAFTMMFLKF